MQKHFVISPSHRLAWLIVTGHLAALCAVFLIPLPWPALILLCLALLASTAYHVQRDALLLSANSVVALRHERDHVVLFLRNGQELSGTLLYSSLVTPALTVLNISSPHHRHVLLMPDSMNEDSFRRLRVLLKWGSTMSAISILP